MRSLPLLAGVAVALCGIASGPASAQAREARTIALVDSPDAESDRIGELAGVLRSHLAGEAQVRVVPGDPEGGSPAERTAWGAERAVTEGVAAVLWLEPDDDGSLTLWVVTERARGRSLHVEPGNAFDQNRTLALAARSLLVRTFAEADEAARDDGEPPDRAPRSDAEPIRVGPHAVMGTVLRLGTDGVAGGFRLEAGLRPSPYLSLRAGIDLLLEEGMATGLPPADTVRSRLPITLAVSGILPLGDLELSAGLVGSLTVAYLARDGMPPVEQTRLAPLLGIRIAGRLRLWEDLFVEIPLGLDLRVGDPPGDGQFADSDVVPAVEGSAGLTLGLGGW